MYASPADVEFGLLAALQLQLDGGSQISLYPPHIFRLVSAIFTALKLETKQSVRQQRLPLLSEKKNTYSGKRVSTL